MKYFWPLFLALAVASCSPSKSESSEKKVEHSAQALLAQMTIEEKIGQIIQADISSVTPEQVREYNLGSVLNGGNSAPGGGKTAPAVDWLSLADAFWLASTDASDGGVGIPVIWGTDAVHGHNNLQTAVIFPHNSGLGAAHNPELIAEIGAVTAREVSATGIDWTFAPTLAVAQDDRWGRTYESYSENSDLVAAYGVAMVEGLQGKLGSTSFLKGQKVIATAKHFLGDGGTQFGIDKGDTIGPLDEMLALHGEPYKPAIEAGVQTIMASFSSVNGTKMHGSRHLLRDVLRDEFGFDGFVVGDWNGHAEVPGCTATDCIAALEAGIDMYMAPDSWEGLYNSLLEKAKGGQLDLARLDEAVLRILTVKIRSGLMDAPRPSEREGAQQDVLGSDAHREVARRAVRESLVLLKNEGNTLPIAAGLSVLVTGSGANSMQQQTGGWSLNWQGTGNANEEFQNGETIYKGLAEAIAATGGIARLSADGEFSERPDLAIVVFGEQPYAEYRGDRDDLVFEFEDGENLKMIRRFKDAGIPVVSIFLTGRPLWVNPHLNASDAFVVAWLPGTEGAGIADVLVAGDVGHPRYDFTGRLSFSWPANGQGRPINQSSDPGVLYPYGFGLDYTSEEDWNPLPEDAGVERKAFDGEIIVRGDAAPSLLLYLGDSSNNNTPANQLSAQSLGGAISTSGVDYQAQEDARQVLWSGSGKGRVAIKTSRPIDLSELGAPADLAIELEWQVIEAPQTPILMSMECGDGCEGTIDLSQTISQLELGKWRKTSVPLRCFVEAGLDPAQVTTVFELETNAAAKLALHSAIIRPSDNPDIGCPSSIK